MNNPVRIYIPIIIFLLLIIIPHAPLPAFNSSVRSVVRQESATEDAFLENRLNMVQTIRRYGFYNESILEVMSKIPRHLFVPIREIWQAYRDHPVPIGHGQTISQPYIVAFMTEKAGITGKRALEIGAGSGYQAAVLAHFYDEVYTIEIIKELADSAEERLNKLGYKNIKVKHGDGYHGWEEYAPFDAIVVTAAADHIPPPLIRQLNYGGRMVIPVGGVFQVQNLMLITKDNEGKIRTENLMPVRFVPFVRPAGS